MITPGVPQPFVPFGREHLAHHPGGTRSQPTALTLPSPSTSFHRDAGRDILEAIRECSISEDYKQPQESIFKEEWQLRASPGCGDIPVEEELYFKCNTAIWSKGTSSGCRQVLMCFTTHNNIQHACWCNFTLQPDPSMSPGANEFHENCPQLPSVCILNSPKLDIFLNKGQEFSMNLPFTVHKCWPMKYGLLFERKTETSNRPSSTKGLPRFFSLLHPLDEITPVVQLPHSGKVCFVNEPGHHIIFVSENPSLVVMYDSTSEIHIIYWLRPAKYEEGTFANNDLIQSPHVQHVQQHMDSPILQAVGLCRQTMSSLSPLHSNSSPFHGLGSRNASPQTYSRPQSPSVSALSHMAAISRSQSPTVGQSSGYWNSATPSPNSRSSSAAAISRNPILSNSSLLLEHTSELREPLTPNICLESIWVEPKLFASRDSEIAGAASKVFFTRDMFEQRFLCLFVPDCSQLRCLKIVKECPKRQFLFGSMNIITAKDACNLQNTNLMVIVDGNGSIMIYSGLIKLCKLHVNLGPKGLGLPGHSFACNTSPRRDSIITSSRPPSALGARFDDAAKLLSPVPQEANQFCYDLMMASFTEDTSTVASGVVSVGYCVNNRVTLELVNGAYYRISVPTLKVSPIVDFTLEALRLVLPKDVAVQLMSRWYIAAHVPGSKEVTQLQYWLSFMSLLFGMMGYDVEHLSLVCKLEHDTSLILEGVSKRFKSSENGSNEDWNYLIKSPHHKVSAHLNESKQCSNEEHVDRSPKIAQINVDAPLFQHIPSILYALHLFFEELKLDICNWRFLPHMAKFLSHLARDLRVQAFVDFYWRDFPESLNFPSSLSDGILDEANLKRMDYPSYLKQEPPGIFQHIEDILKGRNISPFPYLPGLCRRTRIIIALFRVLVNKVVSAEPLWEKCIEPITLSGHKTPMALYKVEHWNPVAGSVTNQMEAAIKAIVCLGIRSSELDSFPAGIAVVLKSAIAHCRRKTQPDWPAEAYILMGREDLAALSGSPQLALPLPQFDKKLPVVSENKKTVTVREDDDDGMEHMDNEVLQLHFSHDLRVQEVRRLFQSSKPVRISLVQRPEVSDHEFIEEQERQLYAISIRTMALPIGRGMFTLRNSDPVVTEVLPIPKLCLTGRAPPRAAVLEMLHVDVPPNMNVWPLFHNGVAAGLRITPNSLDIDSTWIVYNKLKGNADYSIEHAGFLMALGLNGHLQNLATMAIYDYAVKGHEMTNVGLLLGISATKRGTMDLAATKLLSIYLEALLPPTSTELDHPHVVQVTAILGIGLVYQGTAHRHMAEVLLMEIGRPPGPEMENSMDRESYSLAAGLALGLVTLGKGSNVPGLSDLGMADQLYHYMVGGPKRPIVGLLRDKYKSPSYQIKEGDAINVDVTSPGATLALGFMFFGTNDQTVADWMKAPDTQHLLDFVRPDLLLLRTLSHGLIMWDSILPTSIWVESHVPKILSYVSFHRIQQNMFVDYETLSQAYCNIIAGACMAVGLKFAGSSSRHAFDTLLRYARIFIGLLGKAASEQAGRSTVETCMNVVILSLAMVMAGTGDLEVLRLCRHLHNRVGQTYAHVLYGSHMATHMAIGLLFFGGGRYTLGTSREAVAAMIIAFFPKFPTHSHDNRYHLQAFRHLYVLAAKPRLIVPRDIDTRRACYTHFDIKFKPTEYYDSKIISLKAPFLLPELHLLTEVTINDPRYWPVMFEQGKNWDAFTNLLERDGTIYVKQRAQCLSYVEDPSGFRSSLAPLVNDKSSKWTVKLGAIKGITSDPMVHNILDNVLLKSSNSSYKELIGHRLMTQLLYECVTQEKLDDMPSVQTLMQHVVWKLLSSLDIWQVRLVAASLSLRSSSVVDEESFRAVCSQMDKACEEWCQDFPDALVRYWQTNSLCDVPPRLVSFLVQHNIPPPHKISAVQSGLGIASLSLQLRNLNLLPSTIIRIHNYLNTRTS